MKIFALQVYRYPVDRRFVSITSGEYILSFHEKAIEPLIQALKNIKDGTSENMIVEIDIEEKENK